MRGKLGIFVHLASAVRLIPAHAGKTTQRSLDSASRRAHPRACGENGGRGCGLRAVPGSSPRMRGKRRARLRIARRPRLIPAHAGKTVDFSATATGPRAHPRACGENLIGLGADLASMGSSPRMRGKRAACSPLLTRSRLIPAHAGKTGQDVFDRRAKRAHPRACGENTSRQRELCRLWGSSPRMRGKRHLLHALNRPRRLIPAHAGKTERPRIMPWAAAAHPRACGENRKNLGA